METGFAAILLHLLLAEEVEEAEIVEAEEQEWESRAGDSSANVDMTVLVWQATPQRVSVLDMDIKIGATWNPG